MPVMPTWVDYLPDGWQARDVVDEALAKARNVAASLPGLGVDAIADRLGEAAAEAARVSVLVGKGHASSVYLPYRAALSDSLPALARAARPYGILAFANVVLSHGRDIEGHVDQTTRAGLDREIAVLEALSGSGRVSRELGYAALGSGRTDLARRFTDDRALRRLADACDARDAVAFYDYVASFPESDMGYGELMFVARAFVVVLEERGAEGIGAAASWLYGAVHDGPKPLTQHRPRPALPRPTPFVRTGPSPFGWSSIVLDSIHGLYGGRAIALSSTGDVEVVDVERSGAVRRARGTLEPSALAALDEAIAQHHPRALRIPARPGRADEGSVTITLVAGADKWVVSAWVGDHDEGFDALMGAIVEAAAATRA